MIPFALKCIPQEFGGTCDGFLKFITNENVINLAYLFAIILFIVGLKKLTSPATARNGNFIAGVGMFIALIATLLDREIIDYQWIVLGIVLGAPIGYVSARKVKMTSMPRRMHLSPRRAGPPDRTAPHTMT